MYDAVGSLVHAKVISRTACSNRRHHAAHCFALVRKN